DVPTDQPEALGSQGGNGNRQGGYTAPGVDLAAAETVVGILQDRLYSLVDLTLTLKHIHWNVVGPTFIAVHEMLDPQYAGAADMVDSMAERIATLGGSPDGRPGS